MMGNFYVASFHQSKRIDTMNEEKSDAKKKKKKK